MKQTTERVILGGVPVDLTTQDAVLEVIRQCVASGTRSPLAIASANLDHIHNFAESSPLGGSGNIRWLTLLDGMPLVVRARQLTGRTWPRLAGSDLIEPILELAAREGFSVGFLGGTQSTHEVLRERLAGRPTLQLAGTWAPERSTVLDAGASAELAETVRKCGVQILFVGLGKPRQEQWIERHGPHTGASVLLAFGAAADFVAGVVPRSPEWARRSGLEWAYRLMREPRRLARRYLIQGPPALWVLLTRSRTSTSCEGAANT